MVELNTQMLEAALLFAGKQDVRFYLNGVCIEFVPGAAYIVATDGHRMLASRQAIENVPTELHGKAYILKSKDLSNILKVNKNRKNKKDCCATIGFAIFSEKMVNLTADEGISLTVTPIDGRFPNWRRILPTECSGSVIESEKRNKDGSLKHAESVQSYNTDYLADCGKVRSIFGAKFKGAGVQFQPNGDRSMRVTFDNAPNTLAVIMPMRGDTFIDPAADWSALDNAARKALEAPSAKITASIVKVE